MIFKSYLVISLLNCLREVYGIVVADMLPEWCKVNHVLHEGQMELRNPMTVIDVVKMVFN